MKIDQALRWGEEKLFQKGIANAQMESCWILASQIRSLRNPIELCLMKSEHLSKRHLQLYKNKIIQRSKRVPLAYVLGFQEFFGMRFFTDPHVLVPRFETELLVEQVLKRVSISDFSTLLEIGAGSGNIAISLAKNAPRLQIIAIELSVPALKIAKKNARLNQVSSRIQLIRGDLFSLPGLTQFDAIVSNPPYVRTKDLRRLQKEIQFEPRIALDGGGDGLKIIEPLIAQSRKYLKQNGLLFLEVGYNQSKTVKRMMLDSGFKKIETVADYSGFERIVIGRI